MASEIPTGAQQSWWGVSSVDPHDVRAHDTLGWVLEGTIAIPRLVQAFESCVQHHAALQTSFNASLDGLRVQALSGSAALNLTLRLEVDEHTESVDTALRASHHAPFTLEGGPLYRVSITALGPETHLIIWTIHRGAGDRHDLKRFMDWIALVYRDPEAHPDQPPLSTPPPEWPDDAQLLEAGDVLHPRLAWPSRQFGHGNGIASFARQDETPWRDTLSTQSGAQDLDPDNLLVSCWFAVVYRWLGAPEAGVNLSASLMGSSQRYPAPISLTLTPSTCWAELISSVSAQRQTVVGRGEFPWSEMRNRLITLGCLSVDEQGFSLQIELDSPWARPIRFEHAEAKPLDVSCLDDAEVLILCEDSEGILRVSADQGRCSVGTLRLLQDSLEEAIARAISQPNSTLSELGWPRAHLPSSALSGARLSAHHPRDLVALFDRIVGDRMDDLALTGGGTHLTYWGLNGRANRLAYAMEATLGRAIGPGDVVGLCSSVTPDLIAGMLAVIKLGGAFTILCPEERQERQSAVIEATAPCMLAGSADALSRLNVVELPTIALDGKGVVRGHPDTSPDRLNQAEAPAQLIAEHERGGGVRVTHIPHRALARLANGSGPHAVNARDRVALVTPLSSSGAILEVWGSLLRGATLQWLPPEILDDAGRLTVELEQGDISVLRLTTARLDRLTRDAPSLCAPLRLLLIDGEPLPPHLSTRILRAPGGRPTTTVRVIGGPETAGLALSAVLDHGDPERACPLGEPTTASTCQVLDADLNPLPIGVPGRIFIGGEATALDSSMNRDSGESLGAHYPLRAIPDPLGIPSRFVARPCLVDTGLFGFTDDQGVLWPAKIERAADAGVAARVPAWALEHPAVSQATWLSYRERGLLALVYGRDRRLSDEGLRRHLLAGLSSWELPTVRLTALNLPLDRDDRLDVLGLEELADAMPPVKEAMADTSAHAQWVSATVCHLLSLATKPPDDAPLSSLGWNLGVAVEFSLALEGRGLRVPLPLVLWRSTDLAELTAITRPESVEERASPAPTLTVKKTLPMSPIQAGEWERMRRGIFAYDVLVMRLDMHLDAELWLLCLDDVLDRYVAPWLYADAETPSLSLQSSRAVQVTRMDLTHLEAYAAEVQLENRLARMSTGAFTNRLPMVDFCLAQTARTTWQMGMSSPSLLVDEVGLRHLAMSVWQAYRARLGGHVPAHDTRSRPDIADMLRRGHERASLDHVERGCEVLCGRPLGPHGYRLPVSVLAERVGGVSLQLDEALSAAIDQEIARSGLSDIRWFETALHLMLLGLHQKPRSVCFTVAPNRELDGAVAAAAIRQRGFELSTLAQRQSWDKAALYAAFVEENERGLDFRLLPVQPLEAAWALSQRKGSCRPGWFARLLSPLARLLNPGRGPLDVGLRLAFRLHRWARTLGRRVRGTPRAVTGSGWVLSYRVEEAELPDGVTMRRPPVTKLGLNPFAGTLFISRTHVGIELIVQGPYTPAVLEAYAESYLSVLRGLSDERRSELATTLAHLATRKDVFDPS